MHAANSEYLFCDISSGLLDEKPEDIKLRMARCADKARSWMEPSNIFIDKRTNIWYNANRKTNKYRQ